MKQYQVIAAFAFAATATSANSALVTVTADFTQFTMGGFYSGEHAFAAQLKVNGDFIDVCGADPLCANAVNNPSSISANLTGDSVSFEYGAFNARQNVFSFTGYSGDVAGIGAENQFSLGRFTFTNGAFHPLAFLGFTLTTHSSDAALDNHVFSGRIRFDTNSPADDFDVLAQADYFTVQDTLGNTLNTLGSVRIYDYDRCPTGDSSAPSCNTGSADLIGHINSLHLDGFANATDGAFLNSSTTSTPATVPVPPAAYLFGSGLLTLLGMRKKYFNFSA